MQAVALACGEGSVGYLQSTTATRAAMSLGFESVYGSAHEGMDTASAVTFDDSTKEKATFAFDSVYTHAHANKDTHSQVQLH